MASNISSIMSTLASQAVSACSSLGTGYALQSCMVGAGVEDAKTPYAVVLKGAGEYRIGDVGSSTPSNAYDKTFRVEFGIFGSPEQIDRIMETLEVTWLKSGSVYNALNALGGYMMYPVSHGHPQLFQNDVEQIGVLAFMLVVRRNYT